MEKLRFGTLGAARITNQALVKPARANPEVEVVAIAARDRRRAEQYAAKRGIPRVLDDYAAVVEDPEIDAVYIPLPNSLHAEWTERALAAGKHVLCEKPFASNAAEGERVAAAAAATDLVVMEAFHYRYHPVAEKILEVVRSGELGEVQRVATSMCIPLPRPKDIRYQYDLAGGAVMDVGCYAIHMNRLFAGGEPEVTEASAKTLRSKPDLDRWLQAKLRYPSGISGVATCALLSNQVLNIGVRIEGARSTLHVINATAPQYANLMWTRKRRERPRWVRVEGRKKASYAYQLEAFANAVLRDGPVLTPPADAVANLKVMDAVYEAAGLPLRGG
jgi:predicted dehydrogenase